jgi:hypothetical protein
MSKNLVSNTADRSRGATPDGSGWGPQHLVRQLFRAPADSAVSLQARLAMMAALLAGTAVVLARQPGTDALQAIWAEDGTIFLAQAVALPVDHAFLTLYAGYLHAVPRILAELAAALPLPLADAVLSGGAALVVAALALLVYRASAGQVRSPVIRAALAGAMVLVPVGQAEVLDNVANLHWFFMFAAFWVLLWRTRHPMALAAGGLVVFLAGASDPLTLLLAPLAVARLVGLRGWRDRFFSVAFAAGLLPQIAAIVVSGGDRQFPLVGNPVKLVGWFAYHVVAQGVFGARLVAHLGVSTVALAGLAMLMVGAAAVLVLQGRAGDRTPVIILAGLMSVLFFAVPVVMTGVSAPRYAVVPVLLMYSAFACLLDAAAHAVPAAAWRGVRLGMLALVVLTAATSFLVPGPRADAARWDIELHRASVTCSRAPVPAVIRVPVAPPGWDVPLSCRALAEPKAATWTETARG